LPAKTIFASPVFTMEKTGFFHCLAKTCQPGTAAAAGHIAMPARAAPQRNLANRHALPVSGSSSYALLFLLFKKFSTWYKSSGNGINSP